MIRVEGSFLIIINIANFIYDLFSFYYITWFHVENDSEQHEYYLLSIFYQCKNKNVKFFFWNLLVIGIHTFIVLCIFCKLFEELLNFLMFVKFYWFFLNYGNSFCMSSICNHCDCFWSDNPNLNGAWLWGVFPRWFHTRTHTRNTQNLQTYTDYNDHFKDGHKSSILFCVAFDFDGGPLSLP